MKKFISYLGILVVLFVIIACALFTSCGLTRIAETKSEFYQKGDTTVQIMTRTSTTIDAKTSIPITSILK